jgi:hypothetical protein
MRSFWWANCSTLTSSTSWIGITSHGALRLSEKASSTFLISRISNTGCRDTWHHLYRAKWKVWHGDLYRASIALSSFYDGVDIHVMTAEADSGRSSVEQVRERLVELYYGRT